MHGSPADDFKTEGPGEMTHVSCTRRNLTSKERMRGWKKGGWWEGEKM